MAEESKKDAGSTTASAGRNIAVRLVPSGDSDLPVLSNYARVQRTPSGVLVDFGFLDPVGMAALARTARAGGKVPESISGRLAARFVVTPDVLVTLHRQLGQAIEAMSSSRKPKESSAPK